MSDDTNDKPLIDVDRDNLDKECTRLPGTFIKYAYAAADARKRMDEAKARLELVEGTIAQQIRKDPGHFGYDKVSESCIKEITVTLPKYQKALQELHAAKHEVANLEAVTSALEVKKRTLTLLVDLHGMSYFGAPKLDRRGVEAVTEIRKNKLRRRQRNEEEED